MGSDNKKRKTGRRITRKRTKRTRMTNKKRTSKRLYKRSLRKNKYKSRKSRSRVKGGHPIAQPGTSNEDPSPQPNVVDADGNALQQWQSRQRQRQERLRSKKNHTQLQEVREDLTNQMRSVTGKQKKRTPYALRRKNIKLSLRRNRGSLKKALGVGIGATAVGVGAALAAPALATVGLGAAGVAGAVGYGLKKGNDLTSLKYSFERIERDKSDNFIFQLTNKENNNNNFFLITGKSSACIDRLITIMNEAYRETSEETDVEQQESESIFPLKLISDRAEELDIEILQHENNIEEEKNIGNDTSQNEKLLNKTYDKKVDDLTLDIDWAFQDTRKKTFELYNNLKRKLLQSANSVRDSTASDSEAQEFYPDKCDYIKLNQWVLGYRETKESIRIQITDLTARDDGETIQVTLDKVKKDDAYSRLKNYIDTNTSVSIKKKNLKDFCENLVYQVNIGELDKTTLEEAFSLILEDTEDTSDLTTAIPLEARASDRLPETRVFERTENLQTDLSPPAELSSPTTGFLAAPASGTQEPPQPAPASGLRSPETGLHAAPTTASGSKGTIMNHTDFIENINYNYTVQFRIHAFKLPKTNKYNEKIYIECYLIQGPRRTYLPVFRTTKLKEWLDKVSSADRLNINSYEQIRRALKTLNKYGQNTAINKVSAIKEVFSSMFTYRELHLFLYFFNQAERDWLKIPEEEKRSKVLLTGTSFDLKNQPRREESRMGELLSDGSE